MSFSKWEDKDGFIVDQKLIRYNGRDKIDKSGIPMCSIDNDIFLDTNNTNSIIIGSKGSCKHQAIIFPMLDSICASGESALVSNYDDEVIDVTKDMFLKNGYSIYSFDFDNALNTMGWNPFSLPVKYYKEGNSDKCLELIENIGYYLLYELEPNSDPFWINSVINYFKGLVFYTIKNNDDVNFSTIYSLSEKVCEDKKEFLSNMKSGSVEYICLNSILNMPNDTFLSVISIFNNSFNRYLIKENFMNMFSNNDILLTDIFNTKSIIYIKSGEKSISAGLLPLFISQIYDSKNDKSKFNILITDFSNYKPIQNFARILDYSINKGICFTLFVPDFNGIAKTYGIDGKYAILANMRTFIYLLSNDVETMEEINKICGVRDYSAIDELKNIKSFEAIVINPRSNPLKTKLLPYYVFKK